MSNSPLAKSQDSPSQKYIIPFSNTHASLIDGNPSKLYQKKRRKISFVSLNERNRADSQDQSENLKAIFQILKANKSLDTIKFIFDDWQELTNEKLQIILSTTSTSLQTLHLEFMMCMNITETSLLYLTQSLKRLPKLQTLKLKFLWTQQFSDESLRYLKKGLKYLTSLRKLLIGFWAYYHITDLGVYHLVKGFKNLASLETLAIHFLDCSRITNIGLNFFNGGLTKLRNLQKLSLSLTGCQMIIDDGLCNLGKTFAKLFSLQTLNLNFIGCDNITDLGFVSLCENIKILIKMQALLFNFSRGPQLSDKAMYSFCELILKLQSLEKVELIATNCTLITEAILPNLLNSLQENKSLRNASFNLKRCSIAEQDLSIFRKELEKLSWLHIKEIN